MISHTKRIIGRCPKIATASGWADDKAAAEALTIALSDNADSIIKWLKTASNSARFSVVAPTPGIEHGLRVTKSARGPRCHTDYEYSCVHTSAVEVTVAASVQGANRDCYVSTAYGRTTI